MSNYNHQTVCPSKLDLLLSEGYIGRDLNSKMYKMKTIINGPKNRKQEPMAINDPVTKELLVNEEEIKKGQFTPQYQNPHKE